VSLLQRQPFSPHCISPLEREQWKKCNNCCNHLTRDEFTYPDVLSHGNHPTRPSTFAPSRICALCSTLPALTVVLIQHVHVGKPSRGRPRGSFSKYCPLKIGKQSARWYRSHTSHIEPVSLQYGRVVCGCSNRDINKTRFMVILFATHKKGLHLFVTFRNNRARFSWKKERVLKNVQIVLIPR